jgi:hypothetical protein
MEQIFLLTHTVMFACFGCIIYISISSYFQKSADFDLIIRKRKRKSIFSPRFHRQQVSNLSWFTKQFHQIPQKIKTIISYQNETV